nr:sensor histidine kinase [Luteolibacter marinus]
MLARSRLIWFLLLASAPAGRGEGQGTEYTVTAFELGCSVSRWDQEDGLPDTRLLDLVQAADRSIWVATFGGIYRFDGVRFTPLPFPPDDPLPEPEAVWDLMVDRQGAIWAATGYRIYRFPPDGGPAQRLGGDIKGGCKQLLERADGSIWLITANLEHLWASRLAGDRFEDVFEVPAGYYPRDAREDSTGVVWISLTDSHLYRMDDRGPAEVEIPGAVFPGGFVRRLDGRTQWIGRTALHDPGKPDAPVEANFGPPDGPHHILSGVEDDHGVIWFGTWGEGLWTRRPDGRLARVTSVRTRLPKECDQVMLDTEGRVWVATDGGLLRFHRGEFLPWLAIGPEESIPAASVAEDTDGGFWFLAGSGAFRQQPGGIVRALPGPRDRFYTQLSPAPDGGAWWIGNGLQLIRTKEQESNVIPAFDPSDRITSLVATSEDGIWCPSIQRTLRLVGNSIESVPHPETGQSFTVRGAVAAADGGILISPESGGIWHYRHGTWNALLGGDDAKRVFPLVVPGADGRIWVRTGPTTVALLENQTLQSIPLDLGREIVGLAEDLDGGLWIQQRNDGVSWLPADHLSRLLTGDTAGISPVRFGRNEGLPSLSTTGDARCLSRDSSGRIWAATIHGFAAIRPGDWQASHERSLPPQPDIGEILGDDQTLTPEADGVELPAGVQTLQLGMFALTLDDPAHTRYRYRLDGFDRGWSEVTGQQHALYRRLAPGDYVFRFSAANRFGIWSDENPPLRVHVAPLWWQRRSIQWLGVTLLFGLAGAVVFGRLRSVRRRSEMLSEFSRRLLATQEDERKRIAHELHDSLGQDLLVIKSRLDIGNFEPAALSGSVAGAIQQVKQMSRELRPALIDRVGLRAALAAKLEEVSDATGLPIEADLGEIDGLLDDESSLSLYRLVQEALNNIVAHSDASEARISAQATRETLEFRIQDDGRGFNPDKLPPSKAGGLGLRGMAERVNHLRGRFDCQSAPGEGTVLRIQIPLHRP